uniref:Zinc finger protein n=1 Tax=Ciona intestinalis TaxID=7719 RepID=Q4H2I8_CIOIN|nr:zinc finger protein [Ciona intestinalis]BAE06789.1 zinc finger protein [Ciona intestinalis]|eukprot:NP_001071971.1 zinc finger protein [Ciona intestinalis]
MEESKKYETHNTKQDINISMNGFQSDKEMNFNTSEDKMIQITLLQPEGKLPTFDGILFDEPTNTDNSSTCLKQQKDLDMKGTDFEIQCILNADDRPTSNPLQQELQTTHDVSKGKCKNEVKNQRQVSNLAKSSDPKVFPCIRKEWFTNQLNIDKLNIIEQSKEINTSTLAADMRAYLRSVNISLDNFAKNYLLRSQGTLSDLLNHPKPWHGLSSRGRDIYMKMIEFLSAENLNELVAVLKQATVAVRPGPAIQNIPSDVMDLLKEGKMPTQPRIVEVAAQFNIHVEYLQQYCEEQSNKQLALKKDKEHGTNTKHSTELMETGNNIKHRRHKDKRICPQLNCGVVLGSKVALDNHMLTHTGERPFKCEICGKGFTTHSNVLSHQRRHNNSNSSNKISKRARKVAMMQDVTDIDDSEVESTEISKSAPSNKESCDLDVKPSAPSAIIIDYEEYSEFDTKLSESTQLTSYCCPLCKKSSFKSLSSLTAHVRRHNAKQPYVCDVCGKRFNSKFNATRHERTHTGVKPFKCPICPSRFTEAGSITAHLRTHTGEKPFQCQFCGKSFSQKGPLQTHLLLHNGSRPYLCEICGKSFNQKTNLKAHEARHSGLKHHTCTVCAMSFQYKSDLHRHMLKHSGDRPYQCRLCSFTFTRLQYLRDHMHKIHDELSLKSDDEDELKCDEDKDGFDVMEHQHPDSNLEELPVLSTNDGASNNPISTTSYIMEVNPTNSDDKLDSSDCISSCLTSISSAMANDNDPSLSSSNINTSNDTMHAVAIMTDHGLMFTNNTTVDLLELSKLDNDVEVNRSDHSDIQSVFVTPTNDETRYVVVNISRENFL